MKKTALITGGAVRVGREIALALAADGWDVAVHYRNSEAQARKLATEIEAMGRKAYLVQANLLDETATRSIFPALAKQGVMPDCLINNASLFEKEGLADFSQTGWHNHMQVNCAAPLHLIRDFAAQYKGSEGNVINITDGMEGWSISPAFLSYALSKQALANATALLVRTLAPRIRINAVAPGPVLEGAQDKPDTFDKLRRMLPLQRTGSPAEICAAIRYILAAPSLTGQTIAIAGGIGAVDMPAARDNSN